jgi:hypothetical protein
MRFIYVLKDNGDIAEPQLSRPTALDTPYKSSRRRFPIKFLNSKFGEPPMIPSELPRYVGSERRNQSRLCKRVASLRRRN